ncbi:unnamed protein product [Pipistrellus nathusii]|uniref:Uncharacterized protein n=1 Tax=Pipistrellus nathusii TaxID=59473 RepID=A0ABP0A6U9_PIPNA
MSQRFVVTPAGGGVESPDPAAAPDPPRVDAMPILHYGREPSRYGRRGPTGTPPGARGREWREGGQRIRGESCPGAGLGDDQVGSRGQRRVNRCGASRAQSVPSPGRLGQQPIPAGGLPASGPGGRCDGSGFVLGNWR